MVSCPALAARERSLPQRLARVDAQHAPSHAGCRRCAAAAAVPAAVAEVVAAGAQPFEVAGSSGTVGCTQFDGSSRRPGEGITSTWRRRSCSKRSTSISLPAAA